MPTIIINSWEVRWHRLSLTIRVALAAMYCTVRRTINIIQNEDFGLPSSEEFDQAAQYPPGHSVPTCQRGEAENLALAVSAAWHREGSSGATHPDSCLAWHTEP